jgi:hypothetical protein
MRSRWQMNTAAMARSQMTTMSRRKCSSKDASRRLGVQSGPGSEHSTEDWFWRRGVKAGGRVSGRGLRYGLVIARLIGAI